MKNSLSMSIRSITDIAPPSDRKQVDYYDTKISKLVLRVSRTGHKAFYIVRRVGASVVWLKLGVFPELTPEDARKEAAKVLGEFAKGSNPAQVKQERKGEFTFSEALQYYFEHKRKRNKQPIGAKTLKDYTQVFNLYLNDIKDRKLSAISKDDVKRLHAAASKVSIYQGNKVIAMISGLFNFLIIEEKFSGLNPALGVKKNPVVSRDRYLSPSEMPRFFEALFNMTNDTMRDYFLLSLLTGARRSNLQSMRWSELDLSEKLWTIPLTKNGTPQTLPLCHDAVELLKHRKTLYQNSEFVFPGAGKAGHIVEPKKAWARLLKDAGIESLRIHDLRRTFGSWQARNNSSLLIIGKTLNHKSQKSTEIYARMDIEPVRESIDQATQKITQAANLKGDWIQTRLPGVVRIGGGAE